MVTQRDIQSLTKLIAPTLGKFQFKRDLMFEVPVAHYLKGFAFDRSGFDKAMFYVEAFIMPLYVPSDHISLLFSQRLTDNGSQIWFYDTTKRERLADALRNIMVHQGLPFLALVNDPYDLLERVSELHSNLQDMWVQVAVAYSAVLANQENKAGEMLQLAEAKIQEQISELQKHKITSAEHTELLQQVREVTQCYAQGHKVASRLLRSWELLTLRKLGLTDFIDSDRSE